jgi:uncharacterized protein YqgV (UPF0045/DUF77 family)
VTAPDRPDAVVVSAQFAVYPLRQEHLAPAIQVVADALIAADLRPEVGSMSTLVVGDSQTLFAALHEGFLRAAAQGPVVMTITVSNACPLPPAEQR